MEALASQRGLVIDADVLRRKGLQWAEWHNGRSGRTARQFVDHLAGALGRPAWLALKYVGEWRWLLDRSDSPWYPTMRLFRQPKLGDWETPIRQLIEQLTHLAKHPGA